MGVRFLNYTTRRRESRSGCKLYNAWKVRRPLYTCNTHHYTAVRSDNMRRERFNFPTSTRFTPTTRQAISIYFFPSQTTRRYFSAESNRSNGRPVRLTMAVHLRERVSRQKRRFAHPLFSVRFVPPGTHTHTHTKEAESG